MRFSDIGLIAHSAALLKYLAPAQYMCFAFLLRIDSAVRMIVGIICAAV